MSGPYRIEADDLLGLLRETFRLYERECAGKTQAFRVELDGGSIAIRLGVDLDLTENEAIAVDAIEYLIGQIETRADLFYYLDHTEALSRLLTAHAALVGGPTRAFASIKPPRGTPEAVRLRDQLDECRRTGGRA